MPFLDPDKAELETRLFLRYLLTSHTQRVYSTVNVYHHEIYSLRVVIANANVNQGVSSITSISSRFRVVWLLTIRRIAI